MFVGIYLIFVPVHYELAFFVIYWIIFAIMKDMREKCRNIRMEYMGASKVLLFREGFKGNVLNVGEGCSAGLAVS